MEEEGLVCASTLLRAQHGLHICWC